MLVVFDLDGTLINIDSIVHFADQEDWDGFADASMDCPDYPAMVAFAKIIQRMPDIDWIIVTTKPERLRARTVNWLSMRGLQPEAMLMRPQHDYSPTVDLKPQLMADMYGEEWRSKVLFAIDDRTKMVDAWRALGVMCMQCAPTLY